MTSLFPQSNTIKNAEGTVQAFGDVELARTANQWEYEVANKQQDRRPEENRRKSHWTGSQY